MVLEKKRWKFNRVILQVIIISVCIGIVGWHIVHNREDLVQLTTFSIKHIIALYIFWFVLNLINAHAALFVYSELGLKTIKFRQWLKIYFIALYLGSSFWQGGKLYRTIVLKKHFAVSYTSSIVFSLFTGWYRAIISLVVANVFILWSHLDLSFYGINLFAITFSVLIFGLAIPFVGKRVFPIKGLKGRKILWVQSKILDLFDQIQLCAHPKILLGLLCYMLITLPLSAGSIYTFYHGFKVSLSLLETTAFTVVNLIVSAFPITPQNLGVTEIVYGFMSESVGIAFGNSMIVMGGLRLVTMLLMALIALILEKSIDLKGNTISKMEP